MRTFCSLQNDVSGVRILSARHGANTRALSTTRFGHYQHRDGRSQSSLLVGGTIILQDRPLSATAEEAVC